jgi:hypothetical protein
MGASDSKAAPRNSSQHCNGAHTVAPVNAPARDQQLPPPRRSATMYAAIFNPAGEAAGDAAGDTYPIPAHAASDPAWHVVEKLWASRGPFFSAPWSTRRERHTVRTHALAAAVALPPPLLTLIAAYERTRFVAVWGCCFGPGVVHPN